MTYHFPDAYAGSNTKIRDTLNNLILKSPQNWREFSAILNRSARAQPRHARAHPHAVCVPMRCAETSVGLPVSYTHLTLPTKA